MAQTTTPARAALFPAGPLAAPLLLCVLPLVGAPPRANPNEVIRVEHAVAMTQWTTHDLRPAVAAYGVSEGAAA